MNDGNGKSSYQEGLELFLEDPFTGFWDDYAFRIDMYERHDSYLIEALMEGAAPEWISVTADQNQVRITLIENEEKSERTVFLPMAADKEISACLQNGILEITIDKYGASGHPGNRTIPVQYKK